MTTKLRLGVSLQEMEYALALLNELHSSSAVPMEKREAIKDVLEYIQELYQEELNED